MVTGENGERYLLTNAHSVEYWSQASRGSLRDVAYWAHTTAICSQLPTVWGAGVWWRLGCYILGGLLLSAIWLHLQPHLRQHPLVRPASQGCTSLPGS